MATYPGAESERRFAYDELLAVATAIFTACGR